MIREQIPRIAVEEAVEETVNKLCKRLDEKGSGTFVSSHEILGVLEEELLEFKVEVHDKSATDRKIAELLDIAVAAVFAVACYNEKHVQ